MNLCARLQIDLARLRLFQAKEANTYAVARSYNEAQRVLAGYQQICGHLHPLLGNDPPWVYPTLLKALAEMLRFVPLTTVLESVGYPAPIVSAEAQRIGDVARRLREEAARLNQQRATLMTACTRALPSWRQISETQMLIIRWFVGRSDRMNS
jgi:hypothetical protein